MNPLRPLGHVFTRYPLLIPAPLILYLFAWGRLMRDYDSFHVVWSTHPVEGVLNGVVVALVLGGCVLAVYLLNDWFTPAGPAPAPPPTPAAHLLLWAILLVVAVLPVVAWPLVLDEDPFRLNPVTELTAPVDKDAPPADGKAPPPLDIPDDNTLGLPADDGAVRMSGCRWWFPLGVVLAGLVAFGLTHVPWVAAHERLVARVALGFVALGYVVMVIYHWAAGPAATAGVGAAVSVVFLLGLVAGLGWAVHSVIGIGWGWALVPVAALGVFLLLVWPKPQTHYRLPAMEAVGRDGGGTYYDTPTVLKDYPNRRQYLPGGEPNPWDFDGGPRLVPDEAALMDAWNKRVTDRYGAPRPLVVVSVSGGASASALYTADVLFTLEWKHPGFVDQVRVISGASGGMLGAAYFVAKNRPGTPLYEARETYVAALTAARAQAGGDRGKAAAAAETYKAEVLKARTAALTELGTDFLAPVLRKWVHKDMPLYFVQWRPTTNDRGSALEEAGWRPAFGGLLDVPFYQLRKEEEAALIPSLVFTPMMIEDGRQLVISNLDLDYMADSVVPDRSPRAGEADDPKADAAAKQRAEQVRRATRRQEVGEPSHTGLEFYRLFPRATGFRLGTAVRLNASFPYLSPSPALPTNPTRHVVDAGYFDNYGTFTATKWLAHHARWMNTAWLGKALGADDPELPTAVLLQVRCFAFEKETRQYLLKGEDGGRTPESGLFSLAAPLYGLFSSRRAQMIYRGDERVDAARLTLARPDPDAGQGDATVQFRRALAECTVDPSLNWSLSPDTRRQLRADVYHKFETRRAADPTLAEFLDLLGEAQPR